MRTKHGWVVLITDNPFTKEEPFFHKVTAASSRILNNHVFSSKEEAVSAKDKFIKDNMLDLTKASKHSMYFKDARNFLNSNFGICTGTEYYRSAPSQKKLFETFKELYGIEDYTWDEYQQDFDTFERVLHEDDVHVRVEKVDVEIE